MRVRMILAAGIAAASQAGAAAQTRGPESEAAGQALARIAACLATVSDADRLACYDAVANSLRAGGTASGSAGTPPPVISDARPAAVFPAPRQDMRAAAPERLTVKVDRIVASVSGRSSFHMSNGQVWTQVEAEAVRNVRVGDEVTISTASFGSFLMSSPRGGKAIRVRLAR